VATIGSGCAGGFERWLGPDVSPASIYLEDAGFISGCSVTWCSVRSSFMFSTGG
jgi:hypothetical protein